MKVMKRQENELIKDWSLENIKTSNKVISIPQGEVERVEGLRKS